MKGGNYGGGGRSGGGGGGGPYGGEWIALYQSSDFFLRLVISCLITFLYSLMRWVFKKKFLGGYGGGSGGGYGGGSGGRRF